MKGASCTTGEAKAASSERKREGRAPALAIEAGTLNVKITTDFKDYAASQGMTMLELRKEGFELSKRRREQ